MIETATDISEKQIERRIAGLKEKLKDQSLSEIEKADIETEIKILERFHVY